METAIKTTLAKKNLEMEKLEQSKKSHLRMINSSAARLKLRLGKLDDQKEIIGETEARKIRMYETHFPGFCYLRNGEYRRKSTSNNISATLDPVQCSEKVKAILFTDSELDIYKTMCLHLLGTHIQSKSHIQRKDGRLCSYVKAQISGNVPNTLQPITQRVSTYANETPTKYDKMLPRYILDVKILHSGVSSCSFKTIDLDSGSDDESKKKRKLLVPVYVNNEIKVIVNSVLEALEGVDSSKFKELVELASSPEELRNMLSKEDVQEFMYDLARNPLVMKPTFYDFVMAHLMFDKIPEKGTLETVAQVLEVYDDSELKMSLNHIRRGILLRHLDLINTNLILRKRSSRQGGTSVNSCRLSNPSFNYSLKYIVSPVSDIFRQDTQEDLKQSKKDFKYLTKASSVANKENTKISYKKSKDLYKSDSRSVSIFLDKISMDESSKCLDDSSDDESYQQGRTSIDSNKCDLHSLTNSQRILLGLKVASLKSRPINMHQFEGKKKVDIAAIINPIIRPQVSDIDYKQNSPENHLRNFALVSLRNQVFNSAGANRNQQLIRMIRVTLHRNAVFCKFSAELPILFLLRFSTAPPTCLCLFYFDLTFCYFSPLYLSAFTSRLTFTLATSVVVEVKQLAFKCNNSSVSVLKFPC